MCSVLPVTATVPGSTDSAAAARWPHPDTRTVTVGGVTVTAAEALRACEVLLASRACAIRSVLLHAGSPLADCDYHAVYRPGMDAARAVLEETGRPGAAGRHLAKYAFAAAVHALVAQSVAGQLEAALEAFGRDERYASAIARDAFALASRHRFAA